MAGQALEMADELGLDELGAHALSTRGFSRVMIGDLDGLRDLQESVRVASSANSPAGRAGYNNLASITADLGDLRRLRALRGEQAGRRALRRRAGAQLAGRRARLRVLLAWRLEQALEVGDRLLGEGEDGLGSLHEVDVLLIRAKILLAREGAEPAFEWREGARDREIRGRPANPLPGTCLPGARPVAAGQGEAASDVAQELLAEWLDRARRTLARVVLGRGPRLRSRWSWAEGTSSWTRRAARRQRRAGSRPPRARAG